MADLAPNAVPPLAAEDYVCHECDFSYAALPIDVARATIQGQPLQVRRAAFAVGLSQARDRPDAGTWSILEYVCHIRDVYSTYTLRLHRAMTDDRPVLEPMLNDLRAARFRYNARDLYAVLDEVSDNAAGFADEIDQVTPAGWDRQVTRLPGEFRSARWLVRQVVHEGRHHVMDIERIATRLSRSDSQ